MVTALLQLRATAGTPTYRSLRLVAVRRDTGSKRPAAATPYRLNLNDHPRYITADHPSSDNTAGGLTDDHNTRFGTWIKWIRFVSMTKQARAGKEEVSSTPAGSRAHAIAATDYRSPAHCHGEQRSWQRAARACLRAAQVLRGSTNGYADSPGLVAVPV
uniref:hypothetical protein n=1 Tax=Actinoplanes sp. CA-084688 TaxID=3239901 RepID=UPI003F498BAE